MQVCLCALFRSKRIGYPTLLGIDRTAELPNGEPKRATSSTCSRRNEIFHVYTNKNKIEFNFPNHHRVSLLVSIYREECAFVCLFAVHSVPAIASVTKLSMDLP